jgi:hypothetical protein
MCCHCCGKNWSITWKTNFFFGDLAHAGIQQDKEMTLAGEECSAPINTRSPDWNSLLATARPASWPWTLARFSDSWEQCLLVIGKVSEGGNPRDALVLRTVQTGGWAPTNRLFTVGQNRFTDRHMNRQLTFNVPTKQMTTITGKQDRFGILSNWRLEGGRSVGFSCSKKPESL